MINIKSITKLAMTATLAIAGVENSIASNQDNIKFDFSALENTRSVTVMEPEAKRSKQDPESLFTPLSFTTDFGLYIEDEWPESGTLLCGLAKLGMPHDFFENNSFPERYSDLRREIVYEALGVKTMEFGMASEYANEFLEKEPIEKEPIMRESKVVETKRRADEKEVNLSVKLRKARK